MKQDDKISVWCNKTHNWKKGKVVSFTKTKVKVIDETAKTFQIQSNFVWRYKHGGKRKRQKHNKTEIIPAGKQKHARRLPRKVMCIKPVLFTRPGLLGDFGYMLSQDAYRDDGIMLFNDNASQFLSKDTSAGGGNAIARPQRQYGHAIGIATGHMGGFQSLTDPVYWYDKIYTAKEIIDMGFDDLTELTLNNPQKHNLYYSSDANGRIGSSIFHIDESVLDYITNKIKSFPSALYKRCQEDRQPE